MGEAALARADPSDRADALAALVARSDIEALIVRRARGADRFDLDLIGACHDLDGRDDHGIFEGTFRDFLAHLAEKEKTGAYLSKNHEVSNFLIELDGERAFCESYHIANEVHRRDGQVVNHRIGGRYLDTLRLVGGRWIIEKRAVIYDWSRALPATQPFWERMTHTRHLRGARSAADPLYAQRPELRGAAPPPARYRPDPSFIAELSKDAMDPRLQQLIDRQDIVDVLYKRARAGDRGDAELAHSCYHEGATERHGEFIGSAAGMIESGYTRPKPDDPLAFMFHFLSNIAVDFADADHAFVESYHVCNLQLRDETRGELDYAIGGRYLDKFERREGRWAITHRDVVFDWSRCDPVTSKFWDLHPGAPFLFGKRGPDDPLYEYVKRGA